METEKHKRLTIKHAAALCFAVYAVILVWQCIQRPETAIAVAALIVIFAVTVIMIMMRNGAVAGTGSDTGAGTSGAGTVAAAKQREETLHRGEMILVSLCVLLFFAYAICRLLFPEVF
ncbi:MAG: hypothetical protein J5703_07110 [Methanomicrobium sp.]|nr:hypothetical protein [Methanomicrobium sp.]